MPRSPRAALGCALATATAALGLSAGPAMGSGGLSTATAPPAATTTTAAPGAVPVPAGMPTSDSATARVRAGGLAAVPLKAPAEVQKAVIAANALIGKPYKYGGGHAKVDDTGYDCSGTISYALIKAGLQKSPLDSTSFTRWGDEGKGTWITVYGNPGHAYVVIAGLRLDTSAVNDTSRAKGPRWRKKARSARGFIATHPVGF